jgi:ribosomal protein L11 methyltransferase
MPFLELSLRCQESEQPRFERALEDVGALAVTMLDANADTANEHAILEPGVGETPLWQTLELRALFAHDTDALLLLAALEAFDPALDWTRAGFRNVEDQDWERAWMDNYAPLRFGERTWIVPWNHDVPAEAGKPEAAIVRLDPGLAFGSGTHPTTSLCLQWLDALAARGELQGRTVLDFGCGSGILALAALKLGAASAVGIDNDPQALLARRPIPSSSPTSSPRRSTHSQTRWPRARHPAGASRCRASSTASRTRCCVATPSGSTRCRLRTKATGCASTVCAGCRRSATLARCSCFFTAVPAKAGIHGRTPRSVRGHTQSIAPKWRSYRNRLRHD